MAVGAFLRLFRLGDQVLVSDELHAVRAARDLDLAEILTRYLPSDHSMPITGFYELLLENGVTLTDLHLRLPGTLAGLLTLVVVPVALADRLGRRVGTVAAWLVAISPGLVFYSRIARSYMPMVLLAFLAAMAFERWWRTRRPGAAAAYVLFGSAAVWFHLVTAPFVAAPLAWGAVAAAGRASRWRDLAALSALGLGMLAGWATFLLPAWESFSALFGNKSGFLGPGASAWLEVAELQAGTVHGWATLLFWALAALGLALLLRRRAAVASYSFASYSLVLVAVGPLAMLVMRPLGWASPLVLNRYLLAGLPFLLVWPAVGLAGLGDRLAARLGPRGEDRRRSVAALPAVLAVCLLALSGPWADARVLYGSFLHSDPFVRFSEEPQQLRADAPLLAFYDRLGQSADGRPLIEYTGLPTWISVAPLEIYQRHHRRPVLVSPEERALFEVLDSGHLVRPAPRTWLALPARWLVVHRHVGWEMDRVGSGGVHIGDEMRRRGHRSARQLGNHLERRWGPPDYEDREIRAWDLDRVRAAAGEPAR